MSVFCDRLNQIMQEKNITSMELCEKTGIPKSAMSQYRSGSFKPKADRIYLLSKALNVSEAWLMGYDVPMEKVSNLVPLKKVRYIPLLGRIACGEPILAEVNIEGKIVLPDEVNADFALTCRGDSMIDARIFDGDIVYIKQQPIVENGEIAAVLIGDEATLKRFYKQGDTVILKAENAAMEPMVYTKSQLKDLKIIGKAVYFLSEVK